MTKRWMLDRRTFLRGAGRVAVALPFLDVMEGSVHAATPTGAPRRFWYQFTPNGVVPSAIKSTGAGASLTLGSCLNPLEKHRADLILIYGLDNAANGRNNPGVGHYGGGPTSLSGAPMVPGGKTKGSGDATAFGGDPGGISLDQAIAASPAGATRFRVLNIGQLGNLLVNYVSINAAKQFVPNEDNPTKLYQKLFADLATGSSGPSPELVRARKQRGTVLDLVKSELDALSPKVSSDDRRTLEAHATAIRETERAMDVALQPAGAGCSKPEAPPASAVLGDSRNQNQLPALVNVFSRLTAYAFRCDLTRVVTNMWIRAATRQTYPWIGVNERHHDLSHNSAGPPMDKLAKIDTWWAQVMADAVQMLKDSPERGGSVFDSTVMLWAHELSNADNHRSEAIPWIIAGDAGAGWSKGRALEFAGRTTNDLLLSLAQTFGLGVQTFGKPEYCNGPLPLA